MQKWHIFDDTRYSGTFEFADYESGRGGIQEQIHILVVLLTYY